MVRNLVILVVVVIVAVLAYDNSRKISESQVRAHYQSQLEAFRASDEEKICGNVADDFELKVVQVVAGRSERVSLDAYTACENSKKTIRLARLMSEQTRGMATLDVAYNIGSIEVSPDGRSAIVQSVGTVKVGEMMLARTRSTEKLSRSLWEIRSHGGESQVWSYSE